VLEDLEARVTESVRLRLRSDVPVGVNLSGGLDSSLLLALVRGQRDPSAPLHTFTFVSGDPRYDELPWVEAMLGSDRSMHHVRKLEVSEVPQLAARMAAVQDEPYGGFPTLAVANLFQAARDVGVLVLLDGQGVDEGWAGYDYYARASDLDTSHGVIQGANQPVGAPEAVLPEFSRLARTMPPLTSSGDSLRDAQLRDISSTKLPRALRFNDRASMMHGTELREPFLDHLVVELGLAQPRAHKIKGTTHKALMRALAARVIPAQVGEAPKRPVQTPQREWLRGPLFGWAQDTIERGLEVVGDRWLDATAVRRELATYRERGGDHSFHVWQWLSVGLFVELAAGREAEAARVA
jgi:asparagine synthase (glutamine-hydrolysing)